MSLVEVLVTLVSTSVGLLGIAALQLVTLMDAQESGMRLQATALAASMLDRIRVNPAGFRGDEYNIAFNDEGDAATRSGQDLHAWQSEIDAVLPGGSAAAAGAIVREPGTNAILVTIRWQMQSQGSPARPFRLVQIRSEI